jgi:hypothetical protein
MARGEAIMCTHFRTIWVIPLALCLLASAVKLSAGPVDEARLTHVVGKVVVADSNSSPTRASLHTPVRDRSVRTGVDSRAEVTFPDETVARLGDNTALAVSSKNRTFELLAGAVLTQVPGGVGGTRLKAANITATVTGTTVLLEHARNAYTKWIVLDGTARVCLKKPGRLGDCILLRAGQMVIGNPAADALPNTVDVDLDRLIKTCHLLTDFPVLPRNHLLTKAVAKQRRLKSHGDYADTNLVIFGRGTLVNMIDSDTDGSKRDGGEVPPPAAGPQSRFPSHDGAGLTQRERRDDVQSSQKP